MFNFLPRYHVPDISFSFGSWGDDTINGTGAIDWVWGYFGNDTISTFGGNDWIRSGKGNDLIFAGEGNDRINAGTGDDVIYGGDGNDSINGSRGFDTAVYEGSIDDYTFRTRGWGWKTKTQLIAKDGSEKDTLMNIEAVRFEADDYTYYLDGRNNEVRAQDDALSTTDSTLTIDSATLLANDKDYDGDTLSISAVSANSTSGASVALQGGQIVYEPGSAFDSLREGETAQDTFTYTVTDGQGSSQDATVTVTITGTNQAPVLSVPAEVSVDENTSAVLTAEATDAEGTELSYSISGEDADLFTVDAETGELIFTSAPDFEAPADADGDGIYKVDITVTDADGGKDTQSVAVNVADVNETVRETFAFDMVGSQSSRLVSFENNAPDFSSAADGFGKYAAGSSPFALVDDSVSFSRDAGGVIDSSTNTDEFFGLTDTINSDNPEGPLEASWTFDISGYRNINMSFDAGAMGDFEGDDTVTIKYSIDGGEEITLFSFTSDDDAAQTYTLASGKVVELNDPFVETNSGTVLSNVLQTLAADLDGTGSELTITLEGSANGSNEAFVIQNLKLEGDTGGVVTPTTEFSIATEQASQSEGNDGTTVFEFTVTRSGDTTGEGSVEFTVGGDVDAADFGGTLPSGSVSFAAGETTKTISLAITGDTVTELSEVLSVTLENPVGGSIGTGEASATVLNDDITPTLISTIQGEGAQSTMVGESVYVQALVTHVTDRGFYLQEETVDSDGNAQTSEGIFVFTGSTPTVSVGDEISLRGNVAEFGGSTQLSGIDELQVLSSGNVLPERTTVTLPLASQEALEALEGMRVSVASGSEDAPLTVIENFNFDRFGQLTISSGNQYQPTHLYDPQEEADKIAELAEQNQNNRILIDDGNSQQNPDEFTFIPVNEEQGDNGNGYLDKDDDFSAGATVRLGTQLDAPIEGILTDAFGEKTLIVEEQLSIVEETNSGARPEQPTDVGGDIKVSSFNVLNYFTTLGQRGASSAEDFQRQTDKIVNAMLSIDADVFGLQELENNGFDDASAIQALVNALNAELTALGRTDELYTFVNPTDGATVGGDAITTGMIYRENKLKVVATEVKMFEEASADATFAIADRLHEFADRDYVGDFQRNRPSIATTFEDENGERFTLAVSHFKSKGPSGLSALAEDIQGKLDAGTIPADQIAQVEADLAALLADPNYDQNDGQAFWAQVREDAAQELHTWLRTDYAGADLDDDFLLIGDLNTYAHGDSVQELVDGGGLTDLISQYLGDEAYSFVFDGQRGSLDHALGSDSLAQQITGITEWHINADEPDLLSYNSRFTDAGYYADDAFAASDHDPLVIGLDLGSNDLIA